MCDLQVLQLMLGSGTMVVPCTLWSPTAKKYDNGIARAMEGVGFPAITLGMVERVTVCEVPKPVYKLQSTRATTVALREEPALAHSPGPRFDAVELPELGGQQRCQCDGHHCRGWRSTHIKAGARHAAIRAEGCGRLGAEHCCAW